MKNIALAGNSSWSILNFRKNLILKLIKNGFHVHVIAPKDSSVRELEHIGCIVHDIDISRRSMNPLNNFALIFKYYRLLKSLSLSHILTFNIKPNLYVCLAASQLSTKVIVNISGLGSSFIKANLITNIVKFLYKISLKKASIVFFQNQSDLALFKESGIYDGSLENLLPGSGIDLNVFTKNNDHLLNGLNKDFVFIGRLIRDKGIIEYLESASAISNQYSHTTFYIYGESDKNNPSFLKPEEINKFSSKNIKFMGKVNDINIALQHADCVVLPSYREGMSRSLLEAAATGIPIIASNVPGCREIVDNSINGFLCKAKSSDDLSNTMKKFLQLNNAEIKTMGDQGRLKAEKEFSVDLVVEKYLAAIN